MPPFYERWFFTSEKDFADDLAIKGYARSLGVEGEDEFQYLDAQTAITGMYRVNDKTVGQKMGEIPNAFIIVTRNQIYGTITEPGDYREKAASFQTGMATLDPSKSIEWHIERVLNDSGMQELTQLGLLFASKTREQQFNSEPLEILTAKSDHLECNGRRVYQFQQPTE